MTLTAAAPASARRMVLDTNVLLSLWVFADSRYLPIRAAVESGSWIALTDAGCLAEFERVLGYPEFKLEVQTQQRILAEYSGMAQAIGQVAWMRLPQCSDQDDQKFLELACGGAAQFLVTSDKALLKLARHKAIKDKLRILSPQGFLEVCLQH
ncbi:MAG: putative toxin-antitoxin system toxin component, PIN family [Proteobacteria bacterium]|nr:putative toxin-antitoxin system toxin component, PIN family [Pseudomonadota bacterium]